MSNLVNIRVKLHMPGARVGEVIAVDAERADRLVAARYADYTNAPPGPPTPPAPPPQSASAPATKLPANSARKDEWVAVAESIGVDVAGMNKDSVIAAVRDAVG